MATEAVKATALSNLDSTPVVQNTTGEGGPGHLREVGNTVAGTTAVTAGSTYQLARFPSNAKLKDVLVNLDATVVTFTGDIGLYYSTSLVDGTPAASAGTKVNGNTGSQLFGAAVALAAQTTPLNVAVTMGGAKRNMPAWKAAGLTKDPNGFFDLVITTTATTSGAPVVTGSVRYVD